MNKQIETNFTTVDAIIAAHRDALILRIASLTRQYNDLEVKAASAVEQDDYDTSERLDDQMIAVRRQIKDLKAQLTS